MGEYITLRCNTDSGNVMAQQHATNNYNNISSEIHDCAFSTSWDNEVLCSDRGIDIAVRGAAENITYIQASVTYFHVQIFKVLCQKKMLGDYSTDRGVGRNNSVSLKKAGDDVELVCNDTRQFHFFFFRPKPCLFPFTLFLSIGIVPRINVRNSYSDTDIHSVIDCTFKAINYNETDHSCNDTPRLICHDRSGKNMTILSVDSVDDCHSVRETYHEMTLVQKLCQRGMLREPAKEIS